jgi:zinc/manganese transport system substrate-binding protein
MARTRSREARMTARLRLIVAGALALSAARVAALDVVTSTEGLAALVREIGGDRVKVESLSRGNQDPHYVDANPTLAVKLRRAALLVDVGLDLEIGWLPGLVNVSRNAALLPGAKGRLTAASAIQVLDAATGPVDRSQGDLHPAGNPHFLSDPRRVEEVAAAIAQRLAVLDGANATHYQGRLDDFRKRLVAARARWERTFAPLRGRPVLTHHRTLTYFLDWAGLRDAGQLEPKPGTPPPPSHVAALVGVVKSQGVKALLVEHWYDQRSEEVLAKHTGAKVVSIPGDVGGDPAARDWFAYLDLIVQRVAGAVGA